MSNRYARPVNNGVAIKRPFRPYQIFNNFQELDLFQEIRKQRKWSTPHNKKEKTNAN